MVQIKRVCVVIFRILNLKICICINMYKINILIFSDITRLELGLKNLLESAPEVEIYNFRLV